MFRALRLGVLALAFAVPACSSDEQVVEGDAACDNLDTSACLFPFPSDHFRQAGGPHGQAHHLAFGPSMPVSERSLVRMSPEPFEVHDGYPLVPAITFVLEGASLEGAPSLDDIGASTDAASLTLVVDAETGELAPHWAELDYIAEDAGVRVIQLRLADALRHDRRYVVGVRGLVDDEGRPVTPSPGFLALRDGTPSSLAGIEARRAHFDAAVFPVLERAGVARGELLLAYDFTTTTEGNSLDRLLTMRDRLYAAIGELGPEYTVDNIVDDPGGAEGPIAAIIEATAKVPSFLLPPVPARPRRLRLDDDGLPAIEGFEDVPFRVQIPRVALSGDEPVAVLQYGHGFLGSDGEADSGWLREWADRHGFLILSSDLQGMNIEAGVAWFASLPDDATALSHIAEAPLQGVMNHYALQRLMKGRFLTEPAIMREGAPLYDPERLYYHGNSQGGTMGNLIALPSLDVTRASLGVPGVSQGFILARAAQWTDLAKLITGSYQDPYEFASITCLVQVGWDNTDGASFAPHYADLPGTPPKQVLLQAALEDAQVNNDVSRLLARLYDARLVEPATREVYGLETAPAPLRDANAYQEVDYGVAPREHTHRPASSETDTHELPRRQQTMQDQSWHFFETGEIIAPCDGACDPD